MRYYRPVDRDRFIVGRGILRRIISAYLALPPSQLRFTYNEYGKPSISDDQNDRALNFNLSHSAELILYAVTRGRSVGVDIEYIREDSATIEIAEHVFSEDEVAALKSLPTDQRTIGFFNSWSRKEAFIKAKGMGVSYPLDRFTVALALGEPPALLKVDDDEPEATQWSALTKLWGEPAGIGVHIRRNNHTAHADLVHQLCNQLIAPILNRIY